MAKNIQPLAPVPELRKRVTENKGSPGRGAALKGIPNPNFIRIVKRFQATQCMSLRETSARIGISPAQLSRIYHSIHSPSLATLVRAAKAMRCPIAAILP